MLKLLFLTLSLFFSSLELMANPLMRVIPVHYRSVTELQSIITPLLNDSEQVIASNSGLIIKASATRQKELKQLISQLDKPLASLNITVIQSNRETAESLNRSIHGQIQFGTKQYLRPRAEILGRYGNTEHFNNSNKQQQIKTLEGKPAYIKTGKIYPLQQNRIYQSAYGYPIIEQSTELIEASTGFQVIPQLSGKHVMLEILPWSDDMKQNGLLNTQSSHTTIRAKLGLWVEIAAVQQQQQQQKYSNRTFSRSHTTANEQMRILIKVDKISASE